MLKRFVPYARMSLFAVVVAIIAPLELHMKWIERARFGNCNLEVAIRDTVAPGGLFLVALTLAVMTYFDVEDIVTPRRPAIGYCYRILCGVPILLYILVPPAKEPRTPDRAFMVAQIGSALLMWLVAVAVRGYGYSHEGT